MQVRPCEIIQRNGKSLVFGMEWFPILGENLEQHAGALARRHKASHWVGTSGAAASVGLLRGTVQAARGRTMYSAAAAFAALHPVGTVVAIVPIPGGRLWLVAVHEGAVMARTDEIHDTAETLQAILNLLTEAHPGLQLLDDRRSSWGLLDTLFEQDPGKPLVRCRHLSGRSVALTMCCAGLALWMGRGVLYAGEQAPAQEPDAHSAWQAALATAAEGHVLHGVGGLKSLLDTLMEQPVHLGGWALRKIECHVRAGQWRCQSRYQREDGDNQSFMRKALPAWELTFDPLEGAGALWAVPVPTATLAMGGLRRASQNQAELVSALQSIRPAFMQLRVETAVPLSMSVPRDSRQQEIPRPPSIRLIQKRAIRLQAPLRSLALLLPETRHMSWDKLELEVSQLSNPGLLNSALSVSMWGVLYELEDDATNPSDTVRGPMRARHGTGGS